MSHLIIEPLNHLTQFDHLTNESIKNNLIIQNKPNLLNAQMNVNKAITKDYENIHLHRSRKNKPNSNPIKPKTKPIKAKTNPIKPNFKPGALQRKLVHKAQVHKAQASACVLNRDKAALSIPAARGRDLHPVEKRFGGESA